LLSDLRSHLVFPCRIDLPDTIAASVHELVKPETLERLYLEFVFIPIIYKCIAIGVEQGMEIEFDIWIEQSHLGESLTVSDRPVHAKLHFVLPYWGQSVVKIPETVGFSEGSRSFDDS
jgi:hypothetical protein